MPKTESITVQRLYERLHMDQNGVLRWKFCPSMPKQWNAFWAGKEAFTAVDGKGYRHGSLDKTYLRLHRVIWAMTHGEWPTFQIDHIDGNRLNNDITNLRAVLHAENKRNQKKPRNNKSGRIGVSWYKPYAKWRATISINGRAKHLGYFDTIEEAAAVRAAAEKTHGYHPNHGRTPTNA